MIVNSDFRALEQSIADNSVGGIRGANTWFVDPRNPYDRQRENGWPVGLKNVGNTCWFSAVIQVSNASLRMCS